MATKPSVKNSPKDALRHIPAVGKLVEALRTAHPAEQETDQVLLTYLAREATDGLRQQLLHGKELLQSNGAPTDDLLARAVEALVAALRRWRSGSSTCRVVNATGIVLHSGLGRAVWPRAALDAVHQEAGYVLLEVDRAEGRRRKRDAFCEKLLCELTGAEAALVVNNNAAATILILSALANGRNVIVSRSQMVEIGGSYRLPDVMEASGCELREVGTTNRSRPDDYERAVDENTGALMLVHTSNYRIVGFTEHVGIHEMVNIGRRVERPVIHDLGSGRFVDFADAVERDEPLIRESLDAGADILCFSGDKLVGGPQAGIILGSREVVEKVRRHPLARAMRIDKSACIALETVLKLYFEPSLLVQRIPSLRMLRAPIEELRTRAETLATRLGDKASAVESTSEMGAGALPAVGLPTWCATLEVDRPSETARALRQRDIPIFCRIHEKRLYFDVRTLLDGDEDEIIAALEDLKN